MKILLHLLAKDIRFNRVSLVIFGLCLLACISWPQFTSRSDLSFTVTLPFLFCASTAVLFTIVLFVSWISLDHPRATDGFLRTRPISPTVRWLSKFLASSLLIVLPALLALAAQAVLLRLDLQGEDYLRLITRAALHFCGCFGVISFLAVYVRRDLSAALLGIPLLILMLMIENDLGNSHRSALFTFDDTAIADLQQSRRFMAWNLAGLSGSVLLAWNFSRRSRRALVGSLAGVILLSGAAFFFWPVNLMRRTSPPIAADHARLAELQAKMEIKTYGLLQPHRATNASTLAYHSDPIILTLPEDALEWPRAVSFDLKSVPLSTPERESAVRWSILTVRRPQPYALPNQILLRSLGLPPELNKTMSACHALAPPSLADGQSILRAVFQERPARDSKISIEGRAVCVWHRPVVLAALPLQAGASFTQDGKSVRILGVSRVNKEFRLRLHLLRFQDGFEMNSTEFDQAPDFQLCVANSSRGEIAMRRSTSTHQDSISVTAVDLKIDSSYEILSVNRGRPAADPEWLGQARLYIIQQQPIGMAEHSLRGELTVTAGP